jgi:hypothetical protein
MVEQVTVSYALTEGEQNAGLVGHVISLLKVVGRAKISRGNE